MVRPLSAVAAAAIIAAAVTMVTAPGREIAIPPEAAGAAPPACAQRPWPYNTCAGTPEAKRPIRLVTVDRLEP